MTINVVNRRTHKTTAHSVYVGRPSPLGNPYYISETHTRSDVVAMYREWLIQKYGNGDPKVVDELYRIVNMHKDLGTIDLVCWCAPEACHADLIKETIEWLELRDLIARHNAAANPQPRQTTASVVANNL